MNVYFLVWQLFLLGSGVFIGFRITRNAIANLLQELANQGLSRAQIEVLKEWGIGVEIDE